MINLNIYSGKNVINNFSKFFKLKKKKMPTIYFCLNLKKNHVSVFNLKILVINVLFII